MILIEDLKYICNYEEKDIDTPTIDLLYISTGSQMTESKFNMIKSNNRDVKIDVIFGESPDEILNDLPDLNKIEIESIDIFSPKLMSSMISRQIYKKDSDLIDYIMISINNITKNGLGFRTTSDISEIDLSINMHCSFVATNSRIGLADTIILHPETFNLYSSIIEQSNRNAFSKKIFLSEKIDINKIIVTKSNNSQSDGIIVINDPNKKCFFIKETECGKNNFSYFNII